jgi:hypothetical protein
MRCGESSIIIKARNDLKSLNIPVGQSQALKHRWKDNTMTKKTKRTNNDPQNTTQKTKG